MATQVQNRVVTIKLPDSEMKSVEEKDSKRPRDKIATPPPESPASLEAATLYTVDGGEEIERDAAERVTASAKARSNRNAASLPTPSDLRVKQGDLLKEMRDVEEQFGEGEINLDDIEKKLEEWEKSLNELKRKRSKSETHQQLQRVRVLYELGQARNEIAELRSELEKEKRHSSDLQERLNKLKSDREEKEQAWKSELDSLLEEKTDLIEQIKAANQTVATLTAENKALKLDLESVDDMSLKAKNQVRDLLMAHYNESEFKALLFKLGIEFGYVASEQAILFDNVQRLVGYCQRRGWMGNLVEAMEQTRPNIRGLLAQLEIVPPESPGKKFQLIIRGHREYGRDWLKSYLAQKLNLSVEEISILGMATGSIRILLGLPGSVEEKLRALQNDSEFFKGFNVKLVAYEALTEREQKAWQEIATHEEYRAVTIERPTAKWSDFVD